jgi:hypothetical protein
MFISFNYKGYLGCKDSKNSWEYELTDSEFGTVFGVVNIPKDAPGINLEMSMAVIQEYDKRNLNIAANLAIAFVWFNKKYPNWSIQMMIDHSKQHDPIFPQYEKDIQKYLVLL